MINVDVVGQLFPSLPTVVVQLLSTLVLFLAARKLLYTPIMEFLQARQKEAESQLDDARMLKIQAKNDRDAAAEELKVTTQKADALLSAAKTNAEKEKQAILLAARESAKATMDNADQWAKRRKAALLDEVKDEMVDIAAKMEGHPDNSTPAFLGGFVASVFDGEHVTHMKCDLGQDLKFACFIPSFELRTEKARAALPKQILHKDAVFNLSRAALLALRKLRLNPVWVMVSAGLVNLVLHWI